MKLSYWPHSSQPWADLLASVRHVDAAGWHGVYVADHFMGDGAGFGPEGGPVAGGDRGGGLARHRHRAGAARAARAVGHLPAPRGRGQLGLVG